jgi:hypothetical protein
MYFEFQLKAILSFKRLSHHLMLHRHFLLLLH